jgi:hypothetical protein
MEVSRKELLEKLRGIDPHDFERLVADVWQNHGWSTTVTIRSNDRGIDVKAKKNHHFKQKYLIQVKQNDIENKVGSPDVQQYGSLRQQEDNVDAVVIITTSSFTTKAEKMAEDLNVKLIDGDGILDMLIETGSLNSILSGYEMTLGNSRGSKRVSQNNIKYEISKIVCPTCGYDFHAAGWRVFVDHFEECGTPSTKPKGMTDKKWSKVKENSYQTESPVSGKAEDVYWEIEGNSFRP